MFEAKIIADSTGYGCRRITTFELCYPRFIHGEVMTHRVFSRNAMSSRAIPVKKMIDQVRNSPAMPVWWGKNQPGMQANEELSLEDIELAKDYWLAAANNAAQTAVVLESIGLHKQVANRILEPFQWMRTLVTSTEWENFYALRNHPDAQPEFQTLAKLMEEAHDASIPSYRICPKEQDKNYFTDGWHLPYVSDEERQIYNTIVLRQISTARCARVSYLTHGGERPDIKKDIELYDRLVGSVPVHASPTEHIAYPQAGTKSGNFRDWLQFRQIIDVASLKTR